MHLLETRHIVKYIVTCKTTKTKNCPQTNKSKTEEIQTAFKDSPSCVPATVHLQLCTCNCAPAAV